MKGIIVSIIAVISIIAIVSFVQANFTYRVDPGKVGLLVD